MRYFTGLYTKIPNQIVMNKKIPYGAKYLYSILDYYTTMNASDNISSQELCEDLGEEKEYIIVKYTDKEGNIKIEKYINDKKGKEKEIKFINENKIKNYKEEIKSLFVPLSLPTLKSYIKILEQEKCIETERVNQYQRKIKCLIIKEIMIDFSKREDAQKKKEELKERQPKELQDYLKALSGDIEKQQKIMEILNQ